MSEHRHSIFFDPSGKRRRFISHLGYAFTLIFSLTITALCLTILILPAHSVRLIEPYWHSSPLYLSPLPSKEETARELLERKTRNKLMHLMEVEKQEHKTATPPADAPYSLVIGFYVNWEPSAYASLRDHIDSLTHIIPAWLSLPQNGKTDPNGKPFVSRFDPTGYDPEVLKLSAKHHVPIIPMIDNAENGAFHWDRLRSLLQDRNAQSRLAISLRDYLKSNRFAGINIDFETGSDISTMPPSERAEAKRLLHDELPRFVSKLHKVFAPAGLLVTQDLPASYTELDYPALCDANDFVVVMFYDQHFVGGNPGPIASQIWVESTADKLFSNVDSSKVVIGVGNYCYDWPVNCDKNGHIQRRNDGEIVFCGIGKKAEIGSALKTASETNAQINMDEDDLNPYFAYTTPEGKAHIVYILDALTAYNQILALKGYEARGAALWYLGSEDPSIWTFFTKGKLGTRIDPHKLENISFSSMIESDLIGDGEILQITSEPKNGHRKIEQNQDGLFTAEIYSSYPSPFTLGRFGNAPNTVALTFDDGPDPVYTPQILKILKQYHVPATFFVIGTQAERYPNIVKDCWNAGCEIGNHTFTHPHLAEVSKLRMKLELNATQRAIESIILHSTKLFRPPFGDSADANPGPREIPLLRDIQNMGYVTVGMNIDPADYEATSSQAIVHSIERQLKQGHVILLHDGGGNRRKTVEALPSIIELLQSKGYKFSTVSGLLGDDAKSKLFPPVRGLQGKLARFDSTVLETETVLLWLVRVIFLVSLAFGALRILVMMPLALINAFSRKPYEPNFRPRTAVIIPAFNEGNIIQQTIESVLANDYPCEEILVIDDGSTDNTAEIVSAKFGQNPKVKLITKENSGKADAINTGIAKTNCEIVVCIDGDTVLAPDAISKLIPHFADHRVAAVAGNVKVGNRDNPLTVWQSIEYITNQNFDRRAYSVFGAVTVVPGALGAWRRDALLEVGGFQSDTLAEDTDITFRLNIRGYKVLTENSALAYTEAPDTISALAKQRFRWTFGTLQCLWKHRRALFNPKYGIFGVAIMPATLLYGVIMQMLAPIVDIAIILALLEGQIATVLVYFATFFVLDMINSGIAFKLDRESPIQLIWLFWQRFFYRQFMYYVMLKSVIAALHGTAVGWNKLKRKANLAVGKA